MLLNNKNKDNSIYYYGPESKYVSGHVDSKYFSHRTDIKIIIYAKKIDLSSADIIISE